MFGEDVIIDADGHEIVTVLGSCLCDGLYSTRLIVVLPFLTIYQLRIGKGELILHGDIYPIVDLEFEADTGNTYDGQGNPTQGRCGSWSVRDMVPVSVQDTLQGAP